MGETDHPTLHNETGIKVGGYIKIDGLISDYSNAPTRGAGEDFFMPSTIATSGESGDSRLNLHAIETRFWLKPLTPTERGDITTHFEIDFMLGQQGNERVGNSYSPRIRHASVSWGRWTVGQTWTNFFNTTALPDYLDFIGPVGVTFARQAQISGLAAPKNYQSAHADIVWSPIERMSLGAEYVWGRREDESGDAGTLNRLQFSAKYMY